MLAKGKTEVFRYFGIALAVLVGTILICSCSDEENESEPVDVSDGDEMEEASDTADEPDADGDNEADLSTEEEGEEVETDPNEPYWPECGTGDYSGNYLIAGPGEAGYDETLAAKALKYDRQFYTIIGAPFGVNIEAGIDLDNEEDRALIDRFINEYDGWDFEEISGGRSVLDVIDHWHKVAGLYGGMGICADAWRYATLRDQGADCDEVERARQQLLKAIDMLHMAFTIGGEPGVVIRGFTLRELSSVETVPLFDEEGNPLPEPKNNGTWREDNSGLYPDFIWEDSCSRDMMSGWAAAAAVVTEIIKGDNSFDQSLVAMLKEDATNVLNALMEVQESGYDLEFPDADGRTTFHGYVHESNLDGSYVPGLKNGFHALMALGIVSAYLYASGDETAESYLHETLLGERDLDGIVENNMMLVDMGLLSNFSNYNMAFTTAYLALRYIDDAEVRTRLAEAIESEIYDRAGKDRQPSSIKQSLFDFVYAYGKAGGSAFSVPSEAPDPLAIANGMETLQEFPEPPFWDYRVENCDEGEIESGQCILNDGVTEREVLGEVGRNGGLICDLPIPMRLRPPSNYYWRSDPFKPNGGGAGQTLMPGVDFRAAYWMGRWMRLGEEQGK